MSNNLSFHVSALLSHWYYLSEVFSCSHVICSNKDTAGNPVKHIHGIPGDLSAHKCTDSCIPLFRTFTSRRDKLPSPEHLQCSRKSKDPLSVSQREKDLSSGGWVTSGHRRLTQTNGDELRNNHTLAWISIAGSPGEAAVQMLIAPTCWAKNVREVCSTNRAESFLRNLQQAPSLLFTAHLFGDEMSDK